MENNDVSQNQDNKSNSSLNNDSIQQVKPKVDISQSVERKPEDDGEVSLYYQAEKIGQIIQKGPGYLYEMADGFEFQNEKFYKGEKEQQKEQPQSYVEGCDMGWC